MAESSNRILAAALTRAQTASRGDIVRSEDISRRDRELLSARGHLREIIRGWYALTTPEAKPRDTVVWHSTFWAFVAAYLADRFGRRYCLSTEASLDLWSGKMATPKQLIAITATGGANPIDLPTGTSLLTYPNAKSLPSETATLHGVQVMPLGIALARTPPTFFRLDPLTAEIVIRQASREEISRALLGNWNAAAAGRLVGALRHVGRAPEAEALTADCEAAGYALTPEDPFEQPPVLTGVQFEWPQAARVSALWQKMHARVLAHCPRPPKEPPSLEKYLAQADAIYPADAYHSLSIEGYRVTPELVARIAAGRWNPENPGDRQQRDAMAALGYFDAHRLVLDTIRKVYAGGDPGKTFEESLGGWYRALFGPAVQAGILQPWQLAGYRDRMVYIQASSHVPPNKDAVPACMEMLFKLLREEPNPWVRAVLGHFVFVFIHPYTDGNGRIGRFLMNVMLASGGYPWTVIRLEHRAQYMSALEKAAVDGDIAPFATFIAAEMALPSP
jgi:Fic/DOC family